ncbi:helix-turn-helix transcriptional regulator [Alcanivorax sp.]|jgi:transcriptional regulator with XRE-family HTH domain|uniref:helix-turn-helix transcriptional regulator n=1 Tax=Alcanivorax sp. TaxID=1872427 RepID=UPI0025C1905E|nr:helix-turn-helix transcriptional regulator [Alcanivorax sp.]
MIDSLLQQLKKRRLALGLKQSDMMLRVGISRQQYQRLESKGNPRLDTLELLAKGLNSQLMLIPKERLAAVRAVLERDAADGEGAGAASPGEKKPQLSDDPWQGLLGDDS